MNVKSVIAGEYTAPPVHGPRIKLSWGITPLASTLRQKISAYPASDTTPSWMRAPPESLMPMIGTRLRSARSITLMTFSANTSPSEPPKTEASWLKSITSRPSILPMPVTTPSPGTRLDSRPNPWARCVAKMSSSSNEFRSTSRPMRSRAVSLCLACWRLKASASPWPASYLRCRSWLRGSILWPFGIGGNLLALHEHPAVAFEVLDPIPLGVFVPVDVGQDASTRPSRLLVVSLHVEDVNQHAIDDVRHRRPLARLLATLAVLLGTFVVWARRGQHDEAFARLHLAVAQPALLGDHAHSFFEPECCRQPGHRPGPVLVGDHRNHGGVGRHLSLLRQLRGAGIRPIPSAARRSIRRWSRSRRALP